jgi:hypothetical protein
MKEGKYSHFLPEGEGVMNCGLEAKKLYMIDSCPFDHTPVLTAKPRATVFFPLNLKKAQALTKRDKKTCFGAWTAHM